ncbi:probable cyclin-dependent serine/threonine-protein kinase DDB_G0292550 [Bactrocera dorsalis]|uniref:Probable cyclin-dependent serine/threonine-protein kinase DDB_G0292550 n=1 Tax=Bactrocera dorsalis TaxID=27457 RepID=A0ABM3K2R4_BACDO|nr:probable cyclin-dependent serine/threonine-protein kinase DDB_G0292550 [Bactrocera dorsalis]XP_049315752.1 probable cyclin-dependent serine/threonine-protein kinase DDB_G0292550 [Bactrocera dorsalis]
MEALQISRFNLVLTCIKNIESFDGNDTNQLPDYIDQVENILPSILEFDSTNQNILFGYIKNKCVGKTREAIHRHSNVNSWHILKEILTKNFGEKYSSNDLMDELKTCRLHGTIENYYFKINKLANRIHNRNLTHGDTTYMTEEVNRISLKTFRDHLPEPTRTMIFARDPETLEDAFKIILGAKHQNYAQFGPAKRDYLNTNIRTNFSNNYNNQNNSFQKKSFHFTNTSNKHNQHFETQQNFPYQNPHSNTNYNPCNDNLGNSNFTSQTKRTNYSQNTNRNKPNSNNNNYDYQFRQPILRSQNEPMEIGNSNVNFPIAGTQNFHI